ncbi:serine/threonine-protein kinase [Streptomyces galbus]|uniref:non-specific serine/threonine protein kinase n=1 Tax=Streptomyces galbus TaxID=33898 RepID=A0ABX1IEJ4_STRGB|nr:serine/threonine-protein kinase [Streptomyces galbus]NKQ23557.1 serine/threonine protein kinase [Streptomyces galbus]
MRLRQSAWSSERVLAGRYRLDALIGSGGAADVHRGFDDRLKRPVAVKIFRTGTDLDMEERFHNEALILARLHHPGLVTVYDAGRHQGTAFLVMQLIEGPTLKDRIAAGPLSPAETVALGAGLAEALDHAHAAGIVHRDVKPSNIILDPSGRPHLTDFGISRLLDSTSRTATGALIGTAAYLAPEQVLGRQVGPAADVYALGLVLLECLTSRLEYDGVPLESAIARLHREPVLPADLPDELASLIREMTCLDERDRPSAHACARRLADLADTLGPVAAPAAAGLTSVVPRGTAGSDPQPTHHDGPPTAGAAVAALAAGASTPAGVTTSGRTRRRLLTVGGTAAVATVMAATLAVTAGSSDQTSGDRASRTDGRSAAGTNAPATPQASTGTGRAAPSDAAPAADSSGTSGSSRSTGSSGSSSTRLRDARLDERARVPGARPSDDHATGAASHGKDKGKGKPPTPPGRGATRGTTHPPATGTPDTSTPSESTPSTSQSPDTPPGQQDESGQAQDVTRVKKDK